LPSAASIPTIFIAQATPDVTEEDDQLSSLGSISNVSEADKMSELSTIPSLATERPDRTPRIGDVALAYDESASPIDAIDASQLVKNPLVDDVTDSLVSRCLLFTTNFTHRVA
jgi:hypothetical protein